VRFIDAWRDRHVAIGEWSPATINAALTRAGQVLDRAVRHGLLPANPMRVGRMKVRNPRKERSWIGPLDAERLLAAVPPPASPSTKLAQPTAMRRAFLGCMLLGGLRVGEVMALWWGDVDLAAGRIGIVDAKTRAGQRRVAVGHELRGLLAAHKPADAAVDQPVFTNLQGVPFAGGAGRSWAGQTLNSAVQAAGLVDGRGQQLALSPHSLRRSYISIALMGGAKPRWVMRQVGHASAELTLAVYAQVVEGEEPTSAELAACERLLGNGEQVPDVGALVPETH
jgi:integrase